MNNEDQYSRAKDLFESLDMGLRMHLEGLPNIVNIDRVEKRPAERPFLIAWELHNSIALPDDLKDFFMTTDGFHMTWSVKFGGDKIMPVGRLHINGSSQVIQLNPPLDSFSRVSPSLADLDSDSDDDVEAVGCRKPKFSRGFRIFELDPCDDHGTVCLVFGQFSKGCEEVTSEIWFLDRAFSWHRLAESFSDYFLLMLIHLGIPHWQYALTSVGLPPQSRQWMSMYAPERLKIDENFSDEFHVSLQSSASFSRQAFDPAKVFSSKATDKRKVAESSSISSTRQNINQNRNAKKPPLSSARTGSSSSSSSKSSLSQPSLKSSR